MERKIEIKTQAMVGKLHEYQPLEIINVSRTPDEVLWDEMMRKYHYLGYDKMIGQRIKYLVLYQNTPIAAISYNRASLRVGVRDAYIGWDEKQKLSRLHQVVNNNRFLILPWVKIKNLAFTFVITHPQTIVERLVRAIRDRAIPGGNFCR
jgi:hypothetical protein